MQHFVIFLLWKQVFHRHLLLAQEDSFIIIILLLLLLLYTAHTFPSFHYVHSSLFHNISICLFLAFLFLFLFFQYLNTLPFFFISWN
jgi:hypothetical protein